MANHYFLRRGRCELSFQFSFLAHSRFTVSSFRPFARRALSTFCPELVAMRARKPWVRILLRFFG